MATWSRCWRSYRAATASGRSPRSRTDWRASRAGGRPGPGSPSASGKRRWSRRWPTRASSTRRSTTITSCAPARTPPSWPATTRPRRTAARSICSRFPKGCATGFRLPRRRRRWPTSNRWPIRVIQRRRSTSTTSKSWASGRTPTLGYTRRNGWNSSSRACSLLPPSRPNTSLAFATLSPRAV